MRNEAGDVTREIGMVIPEDRLPPGFAQAIGETSVDPAVPGAAATAVLMRDGAEGLELLLLKRHRASGFVPGAYVFAGGRVDDADADVELASLVTKPPSEPPLEYWLAAIREVFEESGVLLAVDRRGRGCHTTDDDPRIAAMREALLTDRATLKDVLQQLDLQPDLDALAYAAHWITPVAEPRRYDTRFFYAATPAGCEATADAREMSDAQWLTPREALDRFGSGTLPMVFPTVKTIQGLVACSTVAEAMAAARSAPVKPILPRLERVPGGIGIVIDADSSPHSK